MGSMHLPHAQNWGWGGQESSLFFSGWASCLQDAAPTPDPGPRTGYLMGIKLAALKGSRTGV